MEPYQQLEVDIAKWMDYPPENVVVCSSGTAALHLALEAFQLPAKSRVIIPDFTMIACARAVTLAGHEVVPIDCNAGDLLINMDHVSQHCRFGHRVVMAVHVYGREIDMDFLRRGTAHTPMVIEDLAESHGTQPHPSTDAACWSFYKNKIVAGEEGGAVAFKRQYHADLARQLRCLGFTGAHDFQHVPRGHNYRMSNLHAYAISESLRMVEHNDTVRRWVEGVYNRSIPEKYHQLRRDQVWVYDLRVSGMMEDQQNELVKSLRLKGIGARHGFKPILSQPEYGTWYTTGEDSQYRFSEASKASREVIYLPVDPALPISYHEEVAKTVTAELRRVLGPVS